MSTWYRTWYNIDKEWVCVCLLSALVIPGTYIYSREATPLSTKLTASWIRAHHLIWFNRSAIFKSLRYLSGHTHTHIYIYIYHRYNSKPYQYLTTCLQYYEPWQISDTCTNTRFIIRGESPYNLYVGCFTRTLPLAQMSQVWTVSRLAHSTPSCRSCPESVVRPITCQILINYTTTCYCSPTARKWKSFNWLILRFTDGDWCFTASFVHIVG